jgi:hypothetical protein
VSDDNETRHDEKQMIDYYRHKHQHKRRHVDCDYDGYVDDNKYRGDGGGGGLTYVFPAALALTSSSSHSASSASSIVSNSKHRYHKNFHHLGLTKSIIETSVDYCPAKVICFSACADVQKSAGISNVDKLGMRYVFTVVVVMFARKKHYTVLNSQQRSTLKSLMTISPLFSSSLPSSFA